MRRSIAAADRAVVLGALAAYAAGALILLGTLIATALWPLLSRSL